MHEEFPGVDPSQEARQQYESGSRHADARRNLYKYAAPPRNLWSEMADSLEFSAGDQILDIGTGNGEFVELLGSRVKSEYGDEFKGSLLGIDKFPANFLPRWQRINSQDPLGAVSFAWGDVEQLHFPPNSVDIASVLFVFYHIDQPLESLRKIREILKPGGQLLVATRGVQNQYRMWEYGREIAKKIGSTPPKSFYRRFDIEKANEVLGSMFEIEIMPEPQHSHLVIPLDSEPGDNQGWVDYREALLSLVDLMRDKQTGEVIDETKAISVIDNEVREEFFREVDATSSAGTTGHFIDRVQQGFFVCRNIK